MNLICRLCLAATTQTTTEIAEGSDILLKIQSCLSVQIICNEHLPNHVCFTCIEKLQDIETFSKKVVSNQKRLYQLLNDGREKLESFYSVLNSKHSLKEELTDNVTLLLGNKEKEIINTSLNYVCDNIHNDENEVPTKSEEIFNQPFQYSSEDDMTLSSLKVAKTPSKKKTKTKRKRTTENLARPRKATQIKNKVKNGQKCDKKNPILIINKQDFKCLTCADLFSSQNDLVKHYHKEHSSKKYKDGKIEEARKSYSILEGNGIQSYKCTTCDRVYDNLRAVKRHFEAHVKDRPFICKECGRTYRTVSEIIRHGRAHNGLKLNCSYQCGYSTVYLGALKEHEKRHRTEFKYKCDKCDKGFQVRTWYEEHQNIHNGVKPFACNICGLAFHMNRYLTAHRTTVHPQSSELKRYVCMHCSLPCDSRKALTDHLKDHGIIKRFLCDICGKTLCSREQLKFHNRVHVGEKPYSCSICNKSFTKKCNLKLHELTHTDERTHECLKCGKMYKQRSTLLKHNQKYCRG